MITPPPQAGALKLRGPPPLNQPKSEAMTMPPPHFSDNRLRRATAVVYCEANFGKIDGKTANGLIRHSEKYEILSVIDSRKVGLDAGLVLDDKANGIPIVRDLDEALQHAERVPDWFIFGLAPATGTLIPSQRALSHPAYSTSSFILRGSCPQGVVLQHAPARTHRCDFDQMLMPTPASEMNLIQTFAATRVIGLALNHEDMTQAEVSSAIADYERELGIPVTDALTRSPDHLVDMVLSAFPQIGARVSRGMA